MSQPFSQPMPQPATADQAASLPPPPFTVTGADIRRLRGYAGATQAELASALGYARSSICRWEGTPDKPIPSAQIEKALAFFRARYDVGEGRRTQLADLEQQMRQRSPARPARRIH